MFKTAIFILILCCASSASALLDISMNTSQLYHTDIEITASPTNFTYTYVGDLSSYIQLTHSSSPTTQTLTFIINSPNITGNFYGLINTTYINGSTIIPVLIHVIEFEDPDPSLRLSKDIIELNVDINDTCVVVIDVRNNGNIDLHNYHTELLYNCSWLSIKSENRDVFQTDREQEIVLIFNTSSTDYRNWQNQLYVVTDETKESVFIDLRMINHIAQDYIILENHTNTIESQFVELNASLTSLTALHNKLINNITTLIIYIAYLEQETSMEPQLSGGFSSMNYSISSLNTSLDSNTRNILENINIAGISTRELVANLTIALNEMRNNIISIESRLNNPANQVSELNESKTNEDDMTFFGCVLLLVFVVWILNTANIINVNQYINNIKTILAKKENDG